MSGQPYKYASDPAKFRAEYMETLNQQEENNTINLKANVTYKETGQLPPQSQMKDTRTTAEILADTQKLKIGLIEDLKALGTPNFVLSIIQGIEKSPLNADGSLFTFFAQRAPEIEKILKKQYKYGIKGDVNDTSKFVSFIEDMYTKSKSLNGTVSAYFKTNVNPTIGTLKPADLESIKLLYQQIVKKMALKAGTSTSIRNDPKKRLIDTISKKINYLSKFINERANVELLQTFFETKFLTHPGVIAAHQDGEMLMRMIDDFLIAYSEYVDVIEKLPKYDFINTLLERLERSIQNKNDSLTITILNNMDELFPPIEELIRIQSVMTDLYHQWQDNYSNDVIESQAQIEQADFMQVLADEEAKRQEVFGHVAPPNAKPLTQEEENTINDLTQEIQMWKDQRNDFFEGDEDFLRLTDLIERTQQEVKRIRGYGLKKGRGRPKGRAKGSGITKPYAEVVKSKADYEQGIQESPRFVKFGRYLVNQKMLGDGIFSIKSVGGYRVPDVPATRLSKPLQGVITKMIKGGNLSYDELNTLTEPEKVFLHKVSKKSNIIDKFSIPTPSMDTKDKDIHDFEVMKGEILAGNDNKDLVKKFKSHILKLSREEILPKKEVSEIMEILLELGH